jgi:hypothetical protein
MKIHLGSYTLLVETSGHTRFRVKPSASFHNPEDNRSGIAPDKWEAFRKAVKLEIDTIEDVDFSPYDDGIYFTFEGDFKEDHRIKAYEFVKKNFDEVSV